MNWTVPKILKKYRGLKDHKFFAVDANLFLSAASKAHQDITAFEGRHQIVTQQTKMEFSWCMGCPLDFRLPADKCAIHFSKSLLTFDRSLEFPGAYTLSFADLEIGGDGLIIAAFRPGGDPIVDVNYMSKCGLEHQWLSIWLVGISLIQLINEPRYTIQKPGGTRQQRRQLRRTCNLAPDAWTRVSWDLSKPAGSPESDCPELRRIARHFRRGHWRRAQPHYEGATQRPDAIRPEDRARWWQWIEGRYVGDHTLGIKKSYHAPKMSTGRLAGMPLVGLLHAEGLPDD